MAKTDVAGKIRSHMRRGILEYYLLLILDSRQAYSADIIDLLKKADLLIVEGSLYPLLSQMRKAGIIGYTWAESPQGPPRKYYSLTEKGEATLRQLDRDWAEMNDQIHQVRLEKLKDNAPEITPTEVQPLVVEEDESAPSEDKE